MKATDKFGNEHEFVVDIDYIIGLEMKDKTYSFMKDMESFERLPRIATVDIMAHAVGSSLKDMMALGFGIAEIAKIFMDAFAEAGFISENPEPDSSSEQAE